MIRSLSLIALLSILFVGLTVDKAQAQIVAQRNHTLECSIFPYKVVSNDAFFRVMSFRTPQGSMDSIEGFEFEWGFHYQLLVEVVMLKEVMADASDREYRLIEVISKEPAGEDDTFKMYLNANPYLGLPEPGVSAFEDLGEGVFRYYDEIEIEVPEHLLADFQLILDGALQGNGTFSFVNSGRIFLQTIDI